MKHKLVYIKNIIIGKDVKGCGKGNSNYSLYQFIFFDFVIDFEKQLTSNTCKMLVKQQNNRFTDRLRKQEYVVVSENVIVKFDSLLFLKIFIREDYYIFRENYVLNRESNVKPFVFDFIFVYGNIVFVVYKKNIYIFNNVLSPLCWNDTVFSDNLLSVLKINEFPLES